MARLARALGIARPLGLPGVAREIELAPALRYLPSEPAEEQEGGREEWLDTDVGRRLAVETLPAGAAGDPGTRQAFTAGVRMIAQLQHPAILPVLAVGEFPDGRPWAAVPAKSTRTLAEMAPQLERPGILRAIRRAAEALDYAHDRGVAHGGVSAGAILLDDSGGIYLWHWGKATSSAGPADRRPDIAGLAGAVRAALGRQRSKNRRLAAILAKAESRRRSVYPTAGAFAADLERFEAGLEVRALRDWFGPRLLRALLGRPRLAASLAAALALVLLGALAAGLAELDSSRELADAAGQQLAETRELYRSDMADAELAEKDGREKAATNELEPAESAILRALFLYESARSRARAAQEEFAARAGIVRSRLALARIAIRRAVDVKHQETGPIPAALAHLEAARQAAAGGIEFADELALLADEARGVVAVELATEPEGAIVRVYRLDRDWVQPGPEVATVRGPATLSLETGGYLLEAATSDGSRSARLHIYLERTRAKNRAGPIEIELAPAGPEGFVWIPPGWFQKGEERAWTRVDSGFYLATAELTWGEYERFLASLGARRAEREPCYFNGTDFIPMPRSVRIPELPVSGVSKEDLDHYSSWASAESGRYTYRLPTSDEWEFAARGADGRTYVWGDRFQAGAANLSAGRGGVSIEDLPRIVERPGTRELDTSVLGITELAGNLYEWTGSRSNPGNDFLFLVRGGCWGSPDVEARAAFASAHDRTDRVAGIGARVAAVRTRGD